MAHIIKLKFGSPAAWSYINLTDANHGNIDYYPGTPATGADEITESGRWRITGMGVHPVADLQSKIAEIEQVFYRAGVYAQDQIGAYQVWLTVLLDGTAETWESQIYEARLELTGDVLGTDWANRATDVILVWRRSGFWEKLTAIPVSNANGSGSRVYISNRGDDTGVAPTKNENWLDVAAADVTGDLPAPTMIVIYQNQAINTVSVMHNARTQPTASWMGEGETGTGDTVDATRSGGKYHIYTTPVGGSAGVDVSNSAVPLLSVVDGAWLRFVLSASFTGTVYARPFIEITGKRYYGSKSVLGGGAVFGLYDLGMMRMPQGFNQVSMGMEDGFGSIYAGINFIAASAIAVSVDYFYYVPIDSYARGVLDTSPWFLSAIDTRNGNMLGNNYYPSLHVISSIGTLYGGIWLEPNMAQRLTFKMTVNGLDTLTNAATVNLFAWLRKRTL